MGCMEFHTDFRVCNLGGACFGELLDFQHPLHTLKRVFWGAKTNLGCKPSAIAQAWREGGARALHLQELFSVLSGFPTPSPGCP